MNNRGTHGGKGDSPRPVSDREKFNSEWDRIFKKPIQEHSIDPGKYLKESLENQRDNLKRSTHSQKPSKT